MQHDSKRWSTTPSTPAIEAPKADVLAAPLVLDEALLSLIGGGLTEPPTPVNAEASSPHGNWG